MKKNIIRRGLQWNKYGIYSNIVTIFLISQLFRKLIWLFGLIYLFIGPGKLKNANHFKVFMACRIQSSTENVSKCCNL